MKKIAYISGTRADFGLMVKTLLELKKYFDITIIATGMHLSENWGKTLEEIKKYPFKVRRAEMNLKGNNLSEMVKSLGIGILNITDLIVDTQPDMILLEGDRGESLAGAIIGAHLNIPIIHHGGGDLSDSIDNKIRFGISIFADYHLVGNDESYNRLLNMGISKDKLFNVGEPGLDDIIAKKYTPKEILFKKFKIDQKSMLLLLIFHPNTNEFSFIKIQIKNILEAIKDLKIPTIAIYSNADAGGNIINKFLKQYESKLSFLSVYKNINREDYLGLMNICNALVGNSSSGIIEIPSFKKPFISIGTRQKNRLKPDNVIEVDYNKDNVIQAISKGLFDIEFRKTLENLTNPYGNGKSFLKITEIIRKILLN